MKGHHFSLITSTISILSILTTIYNLEGHSNVIKNIISPILTVALADSMADGLGIYIYETSANQKHKESISLGLQTMLSKFMFSLIYIVPFMFVNKYYTIQYAIITSFILGTCIVAFVSDKIAKERNENRFKAIRNNILFTATIILITFYITSAISHLI